MLAVGWLLVTWAVTQLVAIGVWKIGFGPLLVRAGNASWDTGYAWPVVGTVALLAAGWLAIRRSRWARWMLLAVVAYQVVLIGQLEVVLHSLDLPMGMALPQVLHASDLVPPALFAILVALGFTRLGREACAPARGPVRVPAWTWVLVALLIGQEAMNVAESLAIDREFGRMLDESAAHRPTSKPLGRR